jgi:hypothetical protein
VLCQAASCAVVLATKRRLTALLLVPRLVIAGPGWLEAPRVLPRRDADEHLLDDVPIEWIGGRHRLERRQRDFAGCRAHAWTLDHHLPAPDGSTISTIGGRINEWAIRRQ